MLHSIKTRIKVYFGSVRRIPRQLKRGFGTIDVLMGIGLAVTAITPMVSQWVHNQRAAVVTQTLSSQFRQVSVGASQYIQANYAALSTSIGTVQRVYTGNIMLAGDLPVGFADMTTPSNSTDITTQYGAYKLYVLANNVSTPQGVVPQITSALVLDQGGSCYTPSAGTATTGTVNSVTTNLVPCSLVPRISALVGAHGGYVPSSTVGLPPTVSGAIAQGAGNAWVLTSGTSLGSALSTAPSGALVGYLNFSPQSLISTALSRTNVGNPNANTMFTALNMDGNNINNVGTITSNTVNSGTINNSGTVNTNAINSTYWSSPTGTINFDDPLNMNNNPVYNASAVQANGYVQTDTTYTNTIMSNNGSGWINTQNLSTGQINTNGQPITANSQNSSIGVYSGNATDPVSGPILFYVGWMSVCSRSAGSPFGTGSLYLCH